jgi:hypothetical protein
MKPTKAIQDAGPGLKLERLDRLFDAFYTAKSGGMGMGVSICRSIIKAHGTNVGHAKPTSWRCLSVHPAPISKVDRMTNRRRHRINSSSDPFVTGFSEPTVGHIRGPLPGRCLRPVRSDIKGRADTSEQVILVERLAQVANDPSPQRALPPAVVGVSCY